MFVLGKIIVPFVENWLWSPYVIGQTIYIFMLFLFSFFPRLISAVGDWMFTCLATPCAKHGHTMFGTWCGLSANLECRSEMRCTRLAANTGRKSR